jgi:hypothetical protein
MDQKKDDADDQPDDWKGVEDALEKGFQFSGSQWPVLTATQARQTGDASDSWS